MLQQADLEACLDTVHAIASAGSGMSDFAQAGAACLKRLVGAELTTLSICALDAGHHDMQAGLRHAPPHEPYFGTPGVGHTMAVPIHADRQSLVSFVFNRRSRDFDERERERLELIRPHLGDLYRMTRAVDDARAAWGVPPAAASPAAASLTPREEEVLRWLAAGKTDRDIGDILGISPRTVHKHLQRIYEKMGVETRTAAVVRALGAREAQAPRVLQKSP